MAFWNLIPNFQPKPIKMKENIFIAVLLLSILGCTQKQSDQLTEQQKDQIRKEIKAVGDSIMSRIERLDARWIDYYLDSPDWGMVNADGSRWDYQTFKNVQPDFFNSIISWKWTTTRQDFIFITKDIVICAWDGKDETIMKSGDKIAADSVLNNLYATDETMLMLGDKITFDPHAYTMVFKKIEGQWKIIYQHDSGIPVMQAANNK
jgi:hypothetical protein